MNSKSILKGKKSNHRIAAIQASIVGVVMCYVPEESAGKSTILEMLAMLPFFPRKRRCCTRLAIHLKMRRTPAVSRATLTVLSAEGNEELCREIPQENGWLIVQVGALTDIPVRSNVVDSRCFVVVDG